MANPPTANTSSSSAKQFTENWLQALTLSISSPSARLVKPLMNDVDLVSQSRDLTEQAAASERLWTFAQENKLTSLLALIPTQGNDWVFPDQDIFNYRCDTKPALNTLADWQQGLGIVPASMTLQAAATPGDWAELLRREAVRQRRPMSAQSMQSASLIEQTATALWKPHAWTIRFDLADWITVTYEDPFETERPNASDAEEAILSALLAAESQLLPKSLPAANLADTGPWASSVELLKPIHKGFLASTKSSAWLRRVWSAVWPVIYREQNHLNQPCDIQLIRRELADCFQHVPKATLWMFIAAKLLCSSQLGRGLGISGNFKR